MDYRVTGLSPEPFRHLFGLDDTELARLGAERIVAEQGDGPDRVELRDAEAGERLLLVNYTHQPADTPFRSSHAIFVLEDSTGPAVFENELPPALRSRLLSLRAFDAKGRMTDADVVQGTEAEEVVARLFADPAVAYVHAHYARRGCYAALIERG